MPDTIQGDEPKGHRRISHVIGSGEDMNTVSEIYVEKWLTFTFADG